VGYGGKENIMRTIISTAAQTEMRLDPGFYRVSRAAGLYLQVTAGAGRSWVFRFRFAGKRREMGLGSLTKVGLAEARKAAVAATAIRDQGVNPIEARRNAKAVRIQAPKRPAPANANTFKARAERFLDVLEQGWKRKDDGPLWRSRFRRWVYPSIGDMEIGDIRLSHVVEALSPAWQNIPKTAPRLRGLIERVFDAAIADGTYERANPAALRLIATQLPNKRLVVEHFRAAPLEDVPALYQRIAAEQGSKHRAIQFMILTTARPAEAVEARWDEIDLANKIWTVPAERTKTHRDHIVPLSEPALAVLAAQAACRVGDFVFPSPVRADMALSHDVIAKALRTITEATPHSFRSTWRDWAGDIGDIPREIAEAQLAHSLGATEGAYRRRTAVEKRRAALAAYARWLAGEGANVIAFPKAGLWSLSS
jgi:integrase